MRVGFLGGSFNPIHNGHLHAAREMAQAFSLDRLLLVPSFVPFYKHSARVAYRHRLAMCRAALADSDAIAGLELCTLERGRLFGMPTCELVAALARCYPHSTLFLLVGGDLAPRIPLWKNFAELAATVEIGVMQRDAQRCDVAALTRSGANVHICRGKPLALSSTMVRQAVEHGFSVQEMVPKGVATYIQRHRLYTAPENL